MPEHLLVVFAVWGLWVLAATQLVFPEWGWIAFALGAGVAGQCMINPSYWWLGLGLGGAAKLLMLIADLLLVGADLIRVHVLRANRLSR